MFRLPFSLPHRPAQHLFSPHVRQTDESMTGAICRPIHPPIGRPTFAAPIFARSRPRFGPPLGRAPTLTPASPPPPLPDLGQEKASKADGERRRENKRVINLGHMLPSSPFSFFILHPFSSVLPSPPSPIACSRNHDHTSPFVECRRRRQVVSSPDPDEEEGTRRTTTLAHTHPLSCKESRLGRRERGPCVEMRGKW